jgi:hypothetical protein
MSGKGGKGRSGGCGGHAAGGSGGGRGNTYVGKGKMMKVGLCKDLKGNVFDFGTISAADQLCIMQEKIAQYIGAKYGEDIANELQNKMTVVIPTPTYSSAMMTRHTLRIALVRGQQVTMSAAWLSSRNCALVTKLAKLNNDITQADFEAAQDVPIELTNQKRIDYSNECRNQSRRAAMLETHWEQAYSLILGQCTQLLQDKMKQDSSRSTVSMSYNPLELYRLIEQVVLK